MTLVFKLILISTSFFTALITGLFYAYSCSVNIGLSRLSDTEYLRAMQSINRAILNPWFFASFIGTLLLLPACAWMLYRSEQDSTSFYLILGAALVYLIAVFGVTILGNVPLNDMLDKFDLGAANAGELKTLRDRFEISWNKFHFIRTIGCVVSLLLTLGGTIFRIKTG